MKRIRAAVLLPLLLLTGCAERVTRLPELAFLQPTTEAAETSPAETADPVFQPDTGQPIFIETVPELPAQDLYLRTLQDLHDDLILPSGKELELDGDIEKNRFAVVDIDGDGRDELILEVTQTVPEERFTAVYDIDADGDLRREVRYEAEVTFWSSGVVIASYPDAAEHGDDFIPYAAAQYDKEQDTYTEFAYVSALDRDTLAAHGLEDEYPSGADKSRSGRVYCISGDTPVDVTEYETWYASWHDRLHEISVPLAELTEENIRKLEE